MSTLKALSPSEVATLNTFDPEIRQALIEEGDGNPNFIDFYIIPLLRSDNPQESVISDLMKSGMTAEDTGVGDLGRRPKWKNVKQSAKRVGTVVQKYVLPVIAPPIAALTKTGRESMKKFWVNYGPIVVSVVGAALAPFTGGMSAVAAGVITAGDKAYRARRQAAQMKAAAEKGAEQVAAEAAAQEAEAMKMYDKFYSDNQSFFVDNYSLTPDKWKKLTLDQRTNLMQAIKDGKPVSDIGVPLGESETEPDVATDTPKNRAYAEAVRIIGAGGGRLYNGSKTDAVASPRLAYPVISSGDLPKPPTGMKWMEAKKDVTSIPQLPNKADYVMVPKTAPESQRVGAFLGVNAQRMIQSWQRDGFNYPAPLPPHDRMISDEQWNWLASGNTGIVPLEKYVAGSSTWAPAFKFFKSLFVVDYYWVLGPEGLDLTRAVQDAVPAEYPPFDVAATIKPTEPPAVPKPTAPPSLIETPMMAVGESLYVGGNRVWTGDFGMRVNDDVLARYVPVGQPYQVEAGGIVIRKGVYGVTAPVPTQYVVKVEGQTVATVNTQEEAAKAVTANTTVGSRVEVFADGKSEGLMLRTTAGVVEVPPDMVQQVSTMTKEQLAAQVQKAEAEQKASEKAGFPWWVLAVGGAAAALL